MTSDFVFQRVFVVWGVLLCLRRVCWDLLGPFSIVKQNVYVMPCARTGKTSRNFIYIYIYIYTYTHTHTHAYIMTYTCMYTCTQSLKDLESNAKELGVSRGSIAKMIAQVWQHVICIVRMNACLYTYIYVCVCVLHSNMNMFTHVSLKPESPRWLLSETAYSLECLWGTSVSFLHVYIYIYVYIGYKHTRAIFLFIPLSVVYCCMFAGTDPWCVLSDSYIWTDKFSDLYASVFAHAQLRLLTDLYAWLSHVFSYCLQSHTRVFKRWCLGFLFFRLAESLSPCLIPRTPLSAR
jgi:hypothetical protein